MTMKRAGSQFKVVGTGIVLDRKSVPVGPQELHPSASRGLEVQ